MRYALMSWFKPARKPEQPEHVDPHDPDILAHMGKQTLAQTRDAVKKRRKIFLKQLGL
jgi:hypothetical protein